MEFAPDGRLFVCEQEGRIRIIKGGQLLTSPFLSLQVDTKDMNEAGLLGLAFDPGFPQISTSMLFILPGRFPGEDSHNRISRFTANGDIANTNSEVIIFESSNFLTTGRHNAGDLHFGPDGKLYASTGDGEFGANAQSLSALQGKILRLNADGSIPPDNPFITLLKTNTVRFGPSDCAIRMLSHSGPEPRECSSTMSGKVPGRKLMRAWWELTMDGRKRKVIRRTLSHKVQFTLIDIRRIGFLRGRYHRRGVLRFPNQRLSLSRPGLLFLCRLLYGMDQEIRLLQRKCCFDIRD